MPYLFRLTLFLLPSIDLPPVLEACRRTRIGASFFSQLFANITWLTPGRWWKRHKFKWLVHSELCWGTLVIVLSFKDTPFLLTESISGSSVIFQLKTSHFNSLIRGNAFHLADYTQLYLWPLAFICTASYVFQLVLSVQLSSSRSELE